MTNNQLWQACIKNTPLGTDELVVRVVESPSVEDSMETDPIQEIQISLIYPASRLLNENLEDFEILDLLPRFYPGFKGKTHPTLVPIIARESYESILTLMKN